MRYIFIIPFILYLNQGFSQAYHSSAPAADIAINETNYPSFYANGGGSENEILNESEFFRQMADTLSNNKTKWYQTDTGASLLVSGGLIGLGLYTYKDEGPFNRRDIKDEINRYLPDFSYKLDDLIQFIPFAAVYALDVVGIESQHNTMRKTATMATAIGLNLIVIQGLKYTVKEPRPDGSANNSFPSGHTATAFMGAHIFHKEYAHKSPFYSVGGYVLATMTGVLRQLNDRHWVSDVLVGAGLGISLTELAYFFNDKWWGEKGINEIVPHERKINELKPSFIGLKTGFASLVELRDNDEAGMTAKSGFRFSTEGVYFFNNNFGIGGEIGFQSFPNKIDKAVEDKFEAAGYEVIPQSSGNRMYYAGGYYQFPFGKNALGTRLLIGGIAGPHTEIFIRELDPFGNDEEIEEIVYAKFTPSTNFSWATGVYYKRVLNKNVSLSIYADYNDAESTYDLTYIDRFENGVPIYTPKETRTTNWDSYSFGTSINVMLW